MSRQMFRKMTQPEVELAKSLVKLAFPKLKHIGDMKVSGDKVLYFGQYKMSLIFPNDYKTMYNVGTIKYEDRWAYEVALK